MSKTIEVQLRLPNDTTAYLKKVAKLAGLPPESVIKLILAMEVMKTKDKDKDKDHE